MGRLFRTSLVCCIAVASLMVAGVAYADGAEPRETVEEAAESERIARLLGEQLQLMRQEEPGAEAMTSPLEDAVQEAAPAAVFDRTEPAIGRWLLSIPVVSF